MASQVFTSNKVNLVDHFSLGGIACANVIY